MSDHLETEMVARRVHKLWVVQTEVPTKDGDTQVETSYYVADGIQQVWGELQMDRLDEAVGAVCIRRVVPALTIRGKEES